MSIDLSAPQSVVIVVKVKYAFNISYTIKTNRKYMENTPHYHAE